MEIAEYVVLPSQMLVRYRGIWFHHTWARSMEVRVMDITAPGKDAIGRMTHSLRNQNSKATS